MPQLRDNIGAISRGAMAMMYIMLFYLSSLIIEYEIVSKKLSDIGVVWTRLMHSTLYCNNITRNITCKSPNYLTINYNIAKYQVKWNLLCIYLEVISALAIVTYCSMIE